MLIVHHWKKFTARTWSKAGVSVWNDVKDLQLQDLEVADVKQHKSYRAGFWRGPAVKEPLVGLSRSNHPHSTWDKDRSSSSPYGAGHVSKEQFKRCSKFPPENMDY
uniref:Uncharacterized protein n=1 Tax=Knipowitschia caucasica TaxID=637954 RepID=A0AAV2LGM6_KNICA